MTDNGSNSPRTGGAPDRVRARKGALRADLRTRRRERAASIDPDQRERDGERLLAHLAPLLTTVTCATSFEPLATESNLEPVNAHLAARARLLVPITLDDLDLSWRDGATGDDLGKDAIALADLVIAPALAIGPHGERLGQGGGCYDKALPRRRPGTPVVAVVFPDEFGLDLPTEAHDEQVDAVVTVDALTVFTDRLKY